LRISAEREKGHQRGGKEEDTERIARVPTEVFIEAREAIQPIVTRFGFGRGL
jgi:hypothetical protein